MDTISVNEFNTGFEFAVSHGLPLVGSLVVLGILIYLAKRFFKI